MTNKIFTPTPRASSHVAVAPFKAPPTQSADWALHEFAQAELADQRHLPRLQRIATAFAQKPTAPIPQACPNPAEAKAAYRFFENDAIDPRAIRRAHPQATLQRVARHPVVLGVQDTTALNYSAHPKTRGVGLLGSHSPKTIGLLLHSTLALTPTGQPLGFLHNAVRARHRRGLAAQRHRRPLEQKESYKWVEGLSACQAVAAQCPHTLLVEISDREGDCYAVFAQALSVPAEQRVHRLVRARHDRKLADADRTLWQAVGRQRVAATISVLVGRRGDQPSRVAQLNVRFCPVLLQAPQRQADQPPMRLWALEAREGRAPKGSTPILWRLRTTLPVTSAAEAVEKVRWYAQRWQIEVIHKVLKSGCQIEQRQLETADNLERAPSVDLVVAWRILALCKAARERPEDPISHWLPAAQWQTLCCYVHQRTTAPQRAPGVRQAVRWIAQLGGFLARKCDGEPGTKTLWRGLQQLEAMTLMWQLFQEKERRQRCGQC